MRCTGPRPAQRREKGKRTLSQSLVLALDQGTTGSTALLVDRNLCLRGKGYREFRQSFPRPGYVEHDPNDLWTSLVDAAHEALRTAGASCSDVAAVGLTNQRETTLLWDRETGAPVHPAIVWQCRRSAGICENWRAAGLGVRVREKTGLELDAYFSASKIRWLLDHVPGLEKRARRGQIAFGTVDSWLLWKLTQGRVHATDTTNASRTMLFNIHTLQWDPELLAAFNLPPELLPVVQPSGSVFGRATSPELGGDIPVAGVFGDQHAALFGQGCWSRGLAKNTYGTGCFLVLNTGCEAVASSHNLLTTLAWQRAGEPAQYALEGSVFSAGSAVQWLRDGLGIIREAAETDSLARSVSDNGGVYLVPAFSGLGAPYWDMYARGTVVGLTRDSSRAHLARAVLEAVAWQTRDLLEAMRLDVGHEPGALRVDGGMVANDFLMQFQADALGVPVVRPVLTESTALGAGLLAGLTVGVWSDPRDIAQRMKVDRVFEPHWSADRRESQYAQWGRAVERSRRWVLREEEVKG